MAALAPRAAGRTGQNRTERLVEGELGFGKRPREKGGTRTGPNPLDRGGEFWILLGVTARYGIRSSQQKAGTERVTFLENELVVSREVRASLYLTLAVHRSS